VNGLNLTACALSVCVTATLLAACGGSPPTFSSPSALSRGGGVAEFAARWPVAARFHARRLWAVPDIARNPRLLFISDWGARTVDIYSMPDLRLKGQVGNFEFPYGECADRTGFIWVVDQPTRTIAKLSRTGEAVDTLKDGHGDPYSCAVDPTSGNLAVTNLDSPGSGGAGNVVIYVHAHGSGTVITIPHMYLYTFDGYDTRGYLWVDGYSTTGFFTVASCKASSCSRISLSGGTIYEAGFMQWAEGQKTWYVADGECGGIYNAFCIYPVSRSGALGKAITLTDPQGQAVCDMFQGVITNGKSPVLVGGVNSRFNCYGTVGVARWSLPAGGDSTNGTSDVRQPFGAAISEK